MIKLAPVLNNIIGLKVNEVVSGGSNGSILLFKFGDESIYSILISCAWRLQKANDVLAGWNDSPNPETGNLTIQTKLLEKEFVQSIEVNDFFDLDITFNSGKIIRVFCDITPHANFDDTENWYVADIRANKCLFVTRNFEVVEGNYR